MSVSYVSDISEGSGFFIVLKLIARWKGSLYKLVWLDLVVYLIIYYLINLLYRFALNSAQKETFHMIVAYCDDISTQLPVSFVLGFFVSGVIGRWFQTFMFIPWLNEITYSVMAAVNCADTRVSRKIRLSVMRYLNLAWILAMRRISDRIAERFSQQHKPKGGNTKDDDDCICRGRNEIWSVSQCPDKKISPSRRMQSAKTTPNISSSPLDGQANIKIFNFNENAAPFDGSDEWSIKETLFCFNNDNVVRATFGRIILENEAKAFERIAQQHFQKTHQRYIPEPWVPIEWAVRLIHKAGLHANIADPKIVAAVNKDIGKFRQQLQKLQVFSSLTMPLVYTQVAVISLYSYFFCQIIGAQNVRRNDTVGVSSHSNALPIPVFGVFFFLFLMGWLKVALCVMNPFGDDYEDFECSEILDSNLDVSYRAVLLDEATFPESLKTATFMPKPMKGAESDHLMDFLENTTREIQETEFTCEMSDIQNLEIRQNFLERLRQHCRPNHNRAVLFDRK
uniref:Bestrophin homolog n=1 Tax=Schistocephalus solidus TaxID=70667 RepID=A0A0V0JB48_SCHSO